MTLHLRRAKTDQEGQGRRLANVPGSHPKICPLEALRVWLRETAISEGAIFRKIGKGEKVGKAALHSDSVGYILKRVVVGCGYDSKPYAGHSLPARFATQAAPNGATPNEIMRQAGHTSTQTVARYIRGAQLFHNAPASKLGL